MKRVYYGTCKSESTESEKVVVVPDLDIVDGKFNFQEGDLLTVFFAQTNTIDEPSLVIKIQETEQESSIIDDNGKLIKSLDVEAGMNGAWDAGETVIFAYTQQDTSKQYYWELVDAAHATTLLYGNTKLFDDSDFINWIKQDEEEVDSTIALTPNTLKKFWNLLSTPRTTPEPTPTPTPEPAETDRIGLRWTASDEVKDLTAQPLGVLSLTNSSQGVEITYPIDSVIQKYIYSIQPITHTGQLINNGDGNKPDDPTGTAEKYITKMISENLYFNNGYGLHYNSVPKIILNDGNNDLYLDGGRYIQLKKPTYVSGALNASSLISSGAITANNRGIISTNGNIIGNVLYEGYTGSTAGTPISQIYSKKLEVFSINTGDLTISKNASSGHKTVSIAKSGYRALGCVGYNVNDKSGRSPAHFDPNYANVWECYLTNSTTLQYCIYNMSSSSITINMTVYILYVVA